ncbi:MAG: LysR family transcriptional regulator, partial [Acidimicrobiia bacterium]|nr:LysR family transcriptional regulator [Acidimicrobiia bacterium]
MDVPSLNFTSLRCLQEVERRGSFTDAAVEMGISQPALSHSLAELSRRLGAPLFRKAGRQRVLTEPGRRAARYADAVLGQTAELLRWIRGWERGEVGA